MKTNCVILQLSDSLLPLSLSLSFANQYRFQEILEQIILTINYFELELVRDKRKKKKEELFDWNSFVLSLYVSYRTYI